MRRRLEDYLRASAEEASPPESSHLRARLRYYARLIRDASKPEDSGASRLLWRDESGTARVIEIHGPLIVGRAIGCDLRFDSPLLSQWHLRISPETGRWRIEDLGSTNGTVVNGVVVVSPRDLGAGDLIEAGGVAVVFDMAE